MSNGRYYFKTNKEKISQIKIKGVEYTVSEISIKELNSMSASEVINVNIIRIDSMLSRLERAAQSEDNIEAINLLCEAINKNIQYERRYKRRNMFVEMTVEDVKKCFKNLDKVQNNAFYKLDTI